MVGVVSSAPMGKEKATFAVAPSRWVRPALAGAEHVTAIAHVIVRHEQLMGLPVSAAPGLGVGEFIGGNHVAQRE